MDNNFFVEISSVKNLASKDVSSKLYFTLTLLDDNGSKIGAEMKTRTFKSSSLSSSPISFQFSITNGFAGIGILLVSKGFFKDHQIGQLTLKFNTKLMSGNQIVDDSFPLSSRKAGDTNSARISVKIGSETALSNANNPNGSQSLQVETDLSSDDEDRPAAPPPPAGSSPAAASATKPSLTLSSKWKANDDKLKTSAVIVVEEDSSEDMGDPADPRVMCVELQPEHPFDLPPRDDLAVTEKV